MRVPPGVEEDQVPGMRADDRAVLLDRGDVRRVRVMRENELAAAGVIRAEEDACQRVGVDVALEAHRRSRAGRSARRHSGRPWPPQSARRWLRRPSRGTLHDRPGGARAAGRAPEGRVPGRAGFAGPLSPPATRSGCAGTRGNRRRRQPLERPLASLREDTRSGRTWSSGIVRACVRLSIAKVFESYRPNSGRAARLETGRPLGAGAITPWWPVPPERPTAPRSQASLIGDDIRGRCLASMPSHGAYARGS